MRDRRETATQAGLGSVRSDGGRRRLRSDEPAQSLVSHCSAMVSRTGARGSAMVWPPSNIQLERPSGKGRLQGALPAPGTMRPTRSSQ